MTVRYPTMANREIGDLDHVVRLPMASRIAHGMKTICDHCGKSIKDEFFIGGFKKGIPNLKLHEKCAPTTTTGGATPDTDVK